MYLRTMAARTDWPFHRRNFYLCGSTLFLALSLNRVYSLMVDLLKAQEELQRVKKAPAAAGGSSADSEKLKLLQKDYDALAAKYNATQGSQGTKKSN